MQKKRIVILIVLITLIILMIYLLTQTKTMQNNQQKTAQALYTTIGTKTYEIDNALANEPNIPVLSAGMIPVKYDEEKEEWIITENDENWYDYTSNKPAYMMLNDGVYQSELLPDMTGKKLAKDYVGNDALVVPLDGTIYMWVPRYAYNEEGEIIYIKQEYTVAGSWTLPNIFTYKIENETIPDFSLSGIWVEYNELENESEVTTKINSMTGEYNTYGFIGNTIATNIKNEDGVVGNDALVVPWKNILDLNTNRTILKVINTNKSEPIKAKAYRQGNKVIIEVTSNKWPIAQINDITGNTLSTNSILVEDTDTKMHDYIIIDTEGNIILISREIEFGEGNEIYHTQTEGETIAKMYYRTNSNNARYFKKKSNELAITAIAEIYNDGVNWQVPLLVSTSSTAVWYTTDGDHTSEIGPVTAIEYHGTMYYISACGSAMSNNYTVETKFPYLNKGNPGKYTIATWGQAGKDLLDLYYSEYM